MAAGGTKWRTRYRLGAVIFTIIFQVVNGYEELYTISQLSPKSAADHQHPDAVLQTSRTENVAFSIEPSARYDDADEVVPEDIIRDEEHENHVIVARSADLDRETRSVNIDDIPSSNNEIDNDLELHHRRKYYEIRPTKTIDFIRSRDDDIIMSSDGFGDRLDFRFPEAKRVPVARALSLPGPRIRPTAVQPIFATAAYKDQGRQNTEIQNIITGIVKLLNGNVNVQANSQLLNGRPTRPMASRINNRGPPRISDVPPIPDFDKPVTPVAHAYHPTKTPPPYPFDRPPHHGVNLPEQIVPPMTHRPGLYRPMPPWQKPRPRPPTRRPNPGLPMYKPSLPPLPLDLPEAEDTKPEEEVIVNENESNSENNIHHDETVTSEEDKKETILSQEEYVKEEEMTTVADTTTTSTTTTSTTSTTELTTSSTTTEKTTTVKLTTKKPTEKPTEKPTTTTTTAKPKTEKPIKIEKEKKDPPIDKVKLEKEKYKIIEEKVQNKTRNETTTENYIQSSITESKTTPTLSIASPTPTEGLITYAPVINVSSTASSEITSSTINSQPLPSSESIPYHPYRPRPGIVLDDTDFKPHGSRYSRPEASVITAPETRLPPGYGEIFDVTVSAIQGPGEKGGASVHIENVNLLSGHGDHDDIIVSASGEQGFVSIDGKRTYLNLFDSSTVPVSIRPTHVQNLPQSVPPLVAPPLGPGIGTGVAIPADDIPQPQPPPRRQHQPQVHRPQQTYRRPQPTVRIDTCIVGDDSTCDQAQNEMCRTEAGISSCQCRPGFARRVQRDPCRRVVALLLNLRVDRLYDRKVAWDAKLADKESDPYQQLSYEAIRAIDSAFSMTPFSDDFVSGAVNTVHRGDEHNQGVFVNYTILMQETPETQRAAIATDIQKHILGVIRRRSNNVGASALWVDTPAGSVLPLKDLDECASPELNDCHQLATCTNTWGGFKCACPDTTLDVAGEGGAGVTLAVGRVCRACAASHCNERGVCRYHNGQPYCSCSSGYYGSTCEVDGEVVGVAVGASLAAALVIALTLAALLSWSRKWSREQKAAGMGSPVFSYMAANTIKTPPVGQPPYQVSLEERMRWAQIAEAMAQSNHYAHLQQPEATMATRPSSAMFGGYPTLPPVPLPRMGMHGGHHNGTLNTVASRANTAASHHNLYGYTNHMATESTSSEASSHVQERADLLVPRPKSRARSMHNQTGIYYDVEYENAPEGLYGTK
ncbi:LOW QUALITY PROTEIN: calcium-binding EGF-like domain-containing protein pawn, partial [Aphomia sociella]